MNAQCIQAFKHERRIEADAARVRSLEEALRRIRDKGGEVEGFQLEFGIRGIAKMRDSARYVTESDMKRIVGIARAALSDTPREQGSA